MALCGGAGPAHPGPATEGAAGARGPAEQPLIAIANAAQHIARMR
jgi:hypothetical protein